MKIKPEQLKENNYILLNTLEHKNLVSFLQTYIKEKTIYSTIYYISNIISFLLIILFIVLDFGNSDYNIFYKLLYLSFGFALTILLIPVHEFIHLLAYKSQGAKNTSIKINLKKLYFAAMADEFVINRKEFKIVALAPFTIISFMLLVSLFFLDLNWSVAISGILLAHTAMSAGDFAMLGYFEVNKDKEIVTYDDVESEVTYFYMKVDE